VIESHLIFQKYVPIFIHSIEAKRYLKMSRSYFWRIFYVSKFNLLYLLTQSCIFTVYSSFCPVPGYNTYISPMTRILLQLLSDLLKTYRFNDTFYLSKKNPRYLCFLLYVQKWYLFKSVVYWSNLIILVLPHFIFIKKHHKKHILFWFLIFAFLKRLRFFGWKKNMGFFLFCFSRGRV
jgi:hypothetical protein